MAERNTNPTRRQVVQQLAALGVASAATAPAAALAATSRPAVTPSDVAAADRLFAHDYTPAEEDLMADGLIGRILAGERIGTTVGG